MPKARFQRGKSVVVRFKPEVLKQLGPWHLMQDVERKTMHRVDWYYQDGLLSSTEAERRRAKQVAAMDKLA